MTEGQKTKKVRTGKKVTKALWDQFESVIGEGDDTRPHPLECVYRQSGEREVCELCDAPVAFTDEGFLCCTGRTCGIVYNDILDHGAEWRRYGGGEGGGPDPARTGLPINPLLQESSYGCRVTCQPNCTYEMRKICRYTNWQAMPYQEKSQYDEFTRITAMAQQSGLSKLLIDDALRHHKRVSQHQTFRGSNRDGIIAASVYIACRANGYPRTAKEIAAMFKLDGGSATRGCKNAVAIINGLERDATDADKTRFTKTTALSFIDRYCSKLSLGVELTKLCQFVATRLEKNNWIPENTPHAKAAGIIYFVACVCGAGVTKQDVNRVSGISEVTINKCYKKMSPLESQLIPSAFRREVQEE
jgi:transcription initiation factor TFIIB